MFIISQVSKRRAGAEDYKLTFVPVLLIELRQLRVIGLREATARHQEHRPTISASHRPQARTRIKNLAR
jgi:hypothetical protein